MMFQNQQNPALARKPIHALKKQAGFTLLETLVGLSIGVIVVGVALAALLSARFLSGTVDDASNIQQQGTYLMRIIGGQLRQTASMGLNLDIGSGNTPAAGAGFNPAEYGGNALKPVAFETRTSGLDYIDSGGASATGNDFNIDRIEQIINGGSDSLTTGFKRELIPLFDGSIEALSRNCLGAPTAGSGDQRIESVFSFNAAKNEIRCAGNNANAQPLIENVADFKIRYMVQDRVTAMTGAPRLQYVEAAGISNWRHVQGVEVCLTLYGDERIDLPSGSTYKDCDDNDIDMSSLSGERAKRMHVTWRNVFQLRGQGSV